MRIPPPQLGLVVRYSFVWSQEFAAGQEEGRKDRPCAIVLAARSVDGETRVYVLPVTHTPPTDPGVAMEIPPRIKSQLRLDGARSWIVLDEINDFVWPGYDLRQVPGSEPAQAHYGLLAPRFFDRVREQFLVLAEDRRVKRVPRI